jgi:hypothetical protein
LRIGVLRIDGRDLHTPRSQPTLDLMHRRDQPFALLGTQGCEQRSRQLVRASVRAGAFASASSREVRNPNPAAVRTGRDSGQAGGFQ